MKRIHWGAFKKRHLGQNDPMQIGPIHSISVLPVFFDSVLSTPSRFGPTLGCSSSKAPAFPVVGHSAGFGDLYQQLCAFGQWRGSARSRGARPPSGAVGCAPRPTWRTSSGLWPDFSNRPARAHGGAPEAGALPGTHPSEVIRKSKTWKTFVLSVLLAKFDSGFSSKGCFDAVCGGVNLLGHERALGAAEGK